MAWALPRTSPVRKTLKWPSLKPSSKVTDILILLPLMAQSWLWVKPLKRHLNLALCQDKTSSSPPSFGALIITLTLLYLLYTNHLGEIFSIYDPKTCYAHDDFHVRDKHISSLHVSHEKFSNIYRNIILNYMHTEVNIYLWGVIRAGLFS